MKRARGKSIKKEPNIIERTEDILFMASEKDIYSFKKVVLLFGS